MTQPDREAREFEPKQPSPRMNEADFLAWMRTHSLLSEPIPKEFNEEECDLLSVAFLRIDRSIKRLLVIIDQREAATRTQAAEIAQLQAESSKLLYRAQMAEGLVEQLRIELRQRCAALSKPEGEG